MKLSKLAALLNFAGALLLAASFITSSGSVRFITKGHSLIMCTQNDEYFGVGEDQYARYGSPCPETGGDVVAVVQSSRPWLFWLGWAFLASGFLLALFA